MARNEAVASRVSKISILLTILLGAVLLSFPPSISGQGRPDIVWSSIYPANVSSVAYAPDGKTVFSGNGYNHGGRPGNLWSAADGSLLRSVSVQEIGCGEINRVAYSPDGQVVATITGCTTKLWR